MTPQLKISNLIIALIITISLTAVASAATYNLNNKWIPTGNFCNYKNQGPFSGREEINTKNNKTRCVKFIKGYGGNPLLEVMVISDLDYSILSKNKKDYFELRETIEILNDDQDPIKNAYVQITLTNAGTSQSWTTAGFTEKNGQIKFFLKKAPFGCYSTNVDFIAHSHYQWDQITPANEICKNETE